MWQASLGPVRPLARKQDEKYEQVGSCVLVQLGSELFLFSAAHVLDEIENLWIVGPTGMGYFDGELWKTPMPKTGTRDDDSLDAGIIRITNTGGEFAATGALSAVDLDVDDSVLGATTPKPYHLIGFPATKAWFEDEIERITYEAMVLNTRSLSRDRYAALEIDDQIHLAVEFDQPNVKGEDGSTAPMPHGASGGGIFEPNGKLVAITIETEHKAIFGTRVELFCAILRDKVPALRGQIPEALRPITAQSLGRASRPDLSRLS